ncbi:helix-turn-helix domain-containing protein [Guptibacillus algicola]|uniref:helix-turn-helix domain-containing protein n=1 Tax=Guptibacillus algicola TaxID=225844 RepID=UPI001CD636BF|nr:helix-turn-helix domain-containing protein [Alkalihalobacillus algicola]MCA0986782.1 AraC family transcriptional regulator [Alkalihalobacillus algicola]
MTPEHEQNKQISKVLQYIEAHLTEPLQLENVAKVSTYSPYYFQRLFKKIVGESPANYIKRLRLENAAHLLIYEPHMPVTTIAYQSGFSSLSYFTYSFKAYFEMSPKRWREGAYLERFTREYQDSKKSKLLNNNMKAVSQTNNYNEFRWLDLSAVKTVQLKRCSTVKRICTGPYTEGLPEVWEELYHWANARGYHQDHLFTFGIPKNNPYITPPEKSQYECCLGLHLEYQDLEDEVIGDFEGGNHVLFEFEEPLHYSEREKIIECYAELYSIWLPKSGYRYLSNPIEVVQLEREENSLTVNCKIKAIGLAIEPK